MAPSADPFVETVVLKLASRCNLNCSYCYVYNKGDDSWRGQPAVIRRDTALQTIERVAEHCEQHRLDRFRFVFHGGEPLLAGDDFLAFFIDAARRRLAPGIHPGFAIQTNGTLLTEACARSLRELGVRVGISMDGTTASHDRWRVDHHGRGSYARVCAGLKAAEAAGLAPGLLIVVDIGEDPDAVFEHLLALRPRIVDFLLPQATWDDPPPRRALTGYADWLLAIFRRWTAMEELPFRIRLFEQIVGAVLGIPGNYDALGRGVNATIVIDTDGSIEPVDVLRVCANGMTRRGRNVAADTIDAALTDPLIQHYYHAADELCAACRRCPARGICAGGYLPHRYSQANGFDNPSVYCADLLELISAVQHWAVTELPADLRVAVGLRSMREEFSPPV